MSASSVEIRFTADGTTRVDASLRLTDTTRIRCCTYPDQPPILSITDPPMSLSVTVPDYRRPVSAADVANARRLGDAVAAYVAEVEKRVAKDGALVPVAAADEGSGRRSP